MNTRCGKWLIGYGLFLIAMGAAGYSSNPEKARSALLSGGAFGGISMLWGWLMVRGFRWSRWAAAGTTALLAGVFAWRATVSWLALAEGNPDKLSAAILTSLMGIASVGMLALLLTGRAGREPIVG